MLGIQAGGDGVLGFEVHGDSRKKFHHIGHGSPEKAQA